MFARRATTTRGPRDERGVALVEFALLLPFIALLVFGTIDLGRGFSQQNRLKNASREGASWAQLHPTRVSCASGAPDITDIALGEDTGMTGVTVSVASLNGAGVATAITGCETAPAPAADSTIVVTVSSSFNVITPFVSVLTGNPITQRANTKIQVQQS